MMISSSPRSTQISGIHELGNSNHQPQSIRSTDQLHILAIAFLPACMPPQRTSMRLVHGEVEAGVVATINVLTLVSCRRVERAWVAVLKTTWLSSVSDLLRYLNGKQCRCEANHERSPHVRKSNVHGLREGSLR